ncbi:transglycosylase domain-containing protein [Virgibacillus sp. SK37]|uniref:transglycosylase domain-containing protein n=1 Tax=Virgibacillus sp. SK37 TaxID=403957 RepID=UPI0004D1C960|nr:PBP1A family penicillin-binding protein [Virgibacillus sp. SK37]AIF42481.1 penicillin-binding protein [Virgibacillus sp. SK37]
MGKNIQSRKQYKKEKKKGAKEKSKSKKVFFRIFMAFVLIGVLAIGLGGYTVIAYISDAPEITPAQLENPQSSTIYDMNDQEVTDVAGKEYREVVPLEKIPKHVQNAFIAVEDVRFWEHGGVDIKRIGGAVLANVKNGFGAEGASTITQQLVKKSFLSPEKTIERKVQEAYLAVKMEEKYTKKEILEMYLNKIYFGEGAYGVSTAAEVYFGKSVEELTNSEAALLAGLPQRPSGYNPYKHPELAKKRRDTVISLMEKHGFISAEESKKAQSTAVEDMLTEQKDNTSYDSYVDQVIHELKKKGISEKDLYTSGLKIYTTLDPKAQKFTDKVLTTDEYISYPDDKLKAGVVLLDTKTGAIRAIGGNRSPDEEDIKKGYNYATQLRRQPGSTAKPIMAYGPAIEKLKWSTYKQIEDEEVEINGKTFRNWDRRFHGEISIRTALQWSYNIPAIKTMQKVGPENAKEFAGKLGINLENVYPSYAIGGFEHGTSPMHLAGAYAAFGNKGEYNKPHTIRKVVFPEGKEENFQPESEKAMSDYTAYMVTDMLKTVVKEGTGKMANIPGLPLAGKTGTKMLPEHIQGEGVSDAWFAGYTTDYTAAVWTGYDKTTQETYIKKEDDDISKLIFKYIMEEVSKEKETSDFEKPSSVVEVEIDKETGLKANKYTPEENTVTELFVKGTVPETKPIPVPNNPDPEEKNKEEKEQEKDKEEKDQEKKEKDKEKEKKEQEKKDKEDKTDKDKKDEQNKDQEQNGDQGKDQGENSDQDKDKDKGNEGTEQDKGNKDEGGDSEEGSNKEDKKDESSSENKKDGQSNGGDKKDVTNQSSSKNKTGSSADAQKKDSSSTKNNGGG